MPTDLFRRDHANRYLIFKLLIVILFLINGSLFGQGSDFEAMSQLIEQQEKQIRYVILFALIPVVLLFSFTFFIFYRRRREANFREKELSLKVAKAEMEMKALRAQVNPHFIFNCLNSIQHFIHNNNGELAERYLIKFSRLIRQVLEHSTHAYISLAEDLETLESYIQLEQLRVNHSFAYEFVIDENIDQNQVFVPPLLLQPIIENSVWHGLNNRVDKGMLNIEFKKERDWIVYTVIDNGQKGAKQVHHDGSSFGLSLIKERIQLIPDNDKTVSRLNMSDLTDKDGNYLGKKVEVLVPYEEEI